MRKRATIKTIAQEVGVSVNTVSLALRGSPRVLEKTRRRILEEAKRQGYQRDVLASSLRSGSSHTVALAFGDIANPLFALRMKLLTARLHEAGYQTILLNTDEDAKQESKAMRAAVQHKVDGVVLCPCQQGREALDYLAQQHVPCVLLGRQFEAVQEDAVVWDDFDGAKRVTEALIARGHRKIVHLTVPTYISGAKQRLEGYRAALEAHGISYDPSLVVTLPSPLGHAVGDALRKVSMPFDALFAFSDLLAWRAMTELQGEICFAGFDHMRALFGVPIYMLSVSADLEMETQHAVQLLLDRMAGSNALPRTIKLPVTLEQEG